MGSRKIPSNLLLKRVLSGFFLLFVLSGSPGCGYSQRIHQSQPYAQRFINALVAHQFAQAESMVSPSKRGQFSASYFAVRWRQIEHVAGKPLSLKWTKASYSVQTHGLTLTRNGVEYAYEVTGPRGGHAEIIFVLVQDGNTWFVEDVKIIL